MMLPCAVRARRSISLKRNSVVPSRSTPYTNIQLKPKPVRGAGAATASSVCGFSFELPKPLPGAISAIAPFAGAVCVTGAEFSSRAATNSGAVAEGGGEATGGGGGGATPEPIAITVEREDGGSAATGSVLARALDFTGGRARAVDGGVGDAGDGAGEGAGDAGGAGEGAGTSATAGVVGAGGASETVAF